MTPAVAGGRLGRKTRSPTSPRASRLAGGGRCGSSAPERTCRARRDPRFVPTRPSAPERQVVRLCRTHRGTFESVPCLHPLGAFFFHPPLSRDSRTRGRTPDPTPPKPARTPCALWPESWPLSPGAWRLEVGGSCSRMRGSEDARGLGDAAWARPLPPESAAGCESPALRFR